ncbi:MAG: oligosaccharide flippase family protein, partial [Acidimicrobiia bacterium]
MPQPAQPTPGENHTYGQILRSTALIGGSSVLNVAIGIVRTKAMAMFLGPAGFGLMGLYGSIADVVASIAGMGVNSSGVRQIAEAVGSGETERIARTVAVLRRTSVLLGILGAVFLVVFCRQASTLTFGSDEHAAAVALLSLAVFFRLVSDARGALIQGMRRIPDLARMGVLGALFGTIISIPVVYFLHEKGVVPALVGVAATTLA